MGRPPLPLGTWGKITRTQEGPGKWKARARYRDHDGHTRPVARWGKTGAAAERALVTYLSGRAKPTDTEVDINADTTIEDLGKLWMEKRRAEHLSETTLLGYQRRINRQINPAIGNVRISEATVGRLDKVIRAIKSDSTAKQTRSVLSGMMQLAAQHDAVAHNPVDSTTKRRPKRQKARALTVDDLHRLRARVQAWQGTNRSGPKRGPELPYIFDTLAGTGERIGEVLALLVDEIVWSTIVVDEDGVEWRVPATVEVSGTILDDGRRQPWPKSETSRRVITLPAFAEAALRAQVNRGIPSREGLVFPSRTGGALMKNNVRRSLRAAREYVEQEPGGDPKEFEWVTPHTFRRTVATMIERERDIDTASKVLGHSSSEITRVYVDRAAEAPDVSDVLDVLAPRSVG
ncbi:tyrosine-type recombinase/integrase [Gordonia sp. SND2]|uniref:tyrosine-type recombinase/integrase n=1 Tax=Gordonia sp. SND2 TaxID=3388659 RepID=UPI00398AD561